MHVADAPTPVMFAIIATNKDSVQGGMAPVFMAKDEAEQHEIAMWISRITNAIAHNLPGGTVIMVVNQQS
jgi:hypothetical protein